MTSVENGQAVIDVGPDERIVVPLGHNGVYPGSALELTVRPEKIGMSTTKPTADGASLLRGVVDEVVYLGTSTNYNVTTSTGAHVVVFDQNASSADDIAIRGDNVFLSWNPQHSYAIGER